MTVATVKSVVARFLTNETPEVLVMKGAWGVGKTYAWGQMAFDAKSQMKLASYCYVSLFGISSIAELKLAIFAKTRPVAQIGMKLDAQTINEQWAALTWVGVKKTLARLKDLEFLKNSVSIGLDVVAPFFVQKTIICLDDFERLNDAITPDALLGLISELKEEKNCKVALIFNEDELGDKKEIYRKYREKVVDVELLFSPSADEAIALGFPANLPAREFAREHALSLDIRNIRILRKISNLIELVHTEVKAHHEGVIKQAVMTIVLVGWSYYDKNDKKPTMAFIRDWNRVYWHIGDEKEVDPQRIEWAKVLENYGFAQMDEFDFSICNVVERGYIEETGLTDSANKLHAQCVAIALDDSFTAAWRMYHDNFSNNEDELVRALTTSLKKAVLVVSPINLNGTVKLLRELGKDELANELVDFYVDARKDEPSVFDLDDYAFAGDVTDPLVRERFNEQHLKTHPLPSLIDVASRLSPTSGWTSEDLQVMISASEEDFYNLFKMDHGSRLNGIVRACIQSEGVNGRESVGREARAALVRIGRESRVNELRVARFGVSIEEPPAPVQPVGAAEPN